MVACGGSSTSDTSGGTDGGTIGEGGKSGDSGITCCSPDTAPGCCMKYGGSPDTDGQCPAELCDGMPEPNDPGWKLDKDLNGCPVWTNPKSDFGPGTCGAPPPDSGSETDSGLDAQGD